jgi:ketosteroid isomerase-like protein
MRTASCLLVLCCAVLPATSAHADRDEALLRAQAEAWDRAIVVRDRAAIERNMHERFFQIDAHGRRHDRNGFIASLVDPALSIDPYTVRDLEIRRYGDTALLTGTTYMTGHYDGKPFSTHYRYIDTYVREHGEWTVVAVQVTAIEAPP